MNKEDNIKSESFADNEPRQKITILINIKAEFESTLPKATEAQAKYLKSLFEKKGVKHPFIMSNKIGNKFVYTNYIPFILTKLSASSLIQHLLTSDYEIIFHLDGKTGVKKTDVKELINKKMFATE